MRQTIAILALAAASVAQAQGRPVGVRTVKPTLPAAANTSLVSREASMRIAMALDDTAASRRDRAISALRRAPATVRAEAVRRFTAALAEPRASARRPRALMAMGRLIVETQGQVGRFDGARDLEPALPTLMKIAGDAEDPLRASSLMLLAEAGRYYRTRVVTVARTAVSDPDPAIREAAVAVLGRAGDSSDVGRIATASNDRTIEVRVRALQAFGALERREGVGQLIAALTDTSRLIRATALQALGELGPKAIAALPRVAAMIGDTTDWRGGGNYRETLGAEAAWAASRIAPRRGVSMMPSRVDIDDRDAMLRSDGGGTYVSGADSIKAYVAAALNLDLAGARGDGRATKLLSERTMRRALVFDLNKPGKGASGRKRGISRDKEAVIHIFWRRDEQGKRMISMSALDPTDAPLDIHRADFEFRIFGEPHLLQMGDWSGADVDPRAPKVNGAGTSLPRLWHLDPDEWTVVAPPGSFARLWNISDPARPIDLGLYEFPFAITWSAAVAR